MPRDTRVDTYIAGRAEFARPLLTWLRERVHAACPDAEETIKWARPFFDYKGKPLAGMAAFKEHASFGFWNGEGLVEGKEGEGMGQYGQLATLDDLPQAAAFEAKVREAAERIDSGRLPKRAAKEGKPEAEVPADLAEALAGDPVAAATFEGFTPSCRREYCEWIAEAKRPETKAKRVAETVAWLRQGKRRNWKYETC